MQERLLVTIKAVAILGQRAYPALYNQKNLIARHFQYIESDDLCLADCYNKKRIIAIFALDRMRLGRVLAKSFGFCRPLLLTFTIFVASIWPYAFFDNIYIYSMLVDYIPSPKDTSSIQLDDDLIQLTEAMARNVHEVWAATRLVQGWTWGAERNDTLKHHPCLIPYDQLSEEEREYDRNTAINTLKLIQSLGYRIEKERQ